MRIGIYGGNVRRGKPLASLVDEVVEKEEQGFSSYWTPQVGTFDALTMLALAGQQTNRIELGTAVVPSYPRHPSALAQQAATVNALCGGRLVLGVGPSHAPGIEALGLAYDRPALHMREYVTVLKALGTEGRVDFQGETYQVRTGFACPDASPFRVVVSALAPLMLKAAGEVADGTVTWMVGKNTIANHTAPRITKAAADAGRESPSVIAALPVCVHDDKAQATARAVQIFAGYGQLPNYRRQLDAEGIDQAGEIAVVGNEDEVTAELQAYFDAGATEVIASIYPAGDDSRGSFARTTALLQALAGG
ncbi:MAG: TIGR03564 family F420-dependent LLM class oxidoreductase [Gammaproteobacteria bacterium]|nr:TIGR03564 family F420-dependent LLM class oxidoreductase [Gammaproteobacteria bacterium]